MVVTMAVVGVVQMVSNQIIDMIAVRHQGVTAAGRVYVPSRTNEPGCTYVRVHIGDFQPAFVEMIAVWGMQTTVVQIVNVRAVLERRVAAPHAMHMGVVAVDLVTRHPTSY
jgi:hypothetical protein